MGSHYPTIVLSSGQLIEAKEIALFDQHAVQQIAVLRAQAAEKLGGVSTGIGFIGSPEWALAGMAALSLIEGALSSSARKDGLRLLQEAHHKSQSLSRQPKWFDSRLVRHIEVPHPAGWYVDDLSDAEPGVIKSSGHRRYGHDGDDFVRIRTQDSSLYVRWLTISAYIPPNLDSLEQVREAAAQQQNALAAERAARLPSFKDETSFPKGSTIYDAGGTRIALLPDHSVVVDGRGGLTRFASVHEYRAQTNDRAHWNVVKRL